MRHMSRNILHCHVIPGEGRAIIFNACVVDCLGRSACSLLEAGWSTPLKNAPVTVRTKHDGAATFPIFCWNISMQLAKVKE